MNKLTKVLSVFVLAGAIGTGVAGVAGCTTPSKAHEHNYEYTQIAGNAEKHNVHCKNDGHEGADTQENHTWKDGKCEKCEYVKPEENQGLVVPATVTGLMIEGVTSETITLSSTKTSHTIDKSAIKVYFATGANADVKGTEVPAANVVLELKDSAGAAVSSWENIKTDGVYKVNASIKDATMASGATATLDDLKTTVTVTISNPVKADSLAVKTGDGVLTTQEQSSTNSILPTWKFEVTLANGDKQDVPASEVTVSGLDTTKVTNSGVATLTWGSITGTQAYTITASDTVVAQSYAVNFGELTEEQKTKLKTEDVSIQNGRFVIQARGGEVTAHTGSDPEFEGKYLPTRLKMGGKTIGSDDGYRYIKITTDGEATITVYGYANTGTAGNGDANRYLCLYEDVTYAPKSEGSATMRATATGLVGEKQNTKQKENTKHEFSVSKAGTYWLICEEGDICITYLQVDQLVEKGAGVETVTLTGETKLANLSVKTTTKDYKQTFTLGDKFSVNEEYSLTGVYYNNATMAKVKEEAVTTGVTYWLGDKQLTTDTTLSADVFEKLGEQTVTVKVDGETVTATYKIVVESAVPGVTGITAKVKDTVKIELASAAEKSTLAKTDIEAAVVGENANATVEVTSVKYKVKGAETETEITDSAELGAGEYVIVVTATVTDATANKSAGFSATCELIISVSGAIQDIKYTVTADDVAKVGSSNSTVENTLLDNENGKIVVGTNCKGGTTSATVDGESYSTRIQLGGTYKAVDGSKNAIVLTVKEACTIRVIYNSSGSGARTLSVYDSEGTKVVAGEALESAKVVEYTITAAGTYYLGSEGSGINIWYIEIDYTSNNA